jgi:TP901 family phage tail tape measure protein
MNDLKLRVVFGMVDAVTRPFRAINASSRQLAGTLRQSRGELKELEKTQKNVAAFRELHAGMRSTSTQLQAAQQRVAQLAATMNATASPTRAMVREFNAARNAAGQLRTTHERQQQQLQALRTTLSGAGIDTRNLAQHERDLRARVSAATGAIAAQQSQLGQLAARERALAEARERMNASQGKAGKMAAVGAGMLGAGVATGAALKVPVTDYAKAEDSATQLKVSLMRAGAVVPPEFEKINALAMKLGDKLPGTTSDFQDMMTMLNRQGISAQAILGGMGEATAYLGVQLKKAPDEAAEFAAKMQDATRTTEKDMLSLMDVIQRAFYLGVDDNNMLQGFSKLAPAMDTIKQKGLEGAKALAPLLVMADQAGMKGEASGNAFRKIFQMSLDSKKIGKANKTLGAGQQLNFTDGKGEFGGLDKMFEQFDKLKGLTTQKRLGVLKEVFGDDAETLQAVALLMEKGVAGYQEVQGKMNAQASLQERVNTQLGTLKNLWEATTGTFTNGLVALGETVAPELKALTTWLGEVAQGMGQWARENPRLAGALMKTVAVLAIILAAGGALLLMLASVLGPFAAIRFALTTLGLQGGIFAGVLRLLTGGITMAGNAIMFLGRALLMNPIGLIITGIAVAAYLIYQYWEPIKGFFSGIWDRITQAFSGGILGVCKLLADWSPMGLFYQAFAAVMNWFGFEMPSKFSEFGSNLISGLVNGITGGLGAVKDAISSVADGTVSWFKEKLGIHSPSRVFGELGGFISEGAALGINGEKAKVAKAAVGLASAAVDGFSPAGGSTGLSIDTRASAARAGGSSGLSIDTRAPLAAARGAGAAAPGGDTITITINPGPGSDPEAIARAVRAELDKRDLMKRARYGSRLSD